MKRIFFAVELDGELKEKIEARLLPWLSSTPNLRGIPSANWHITLLFLGNRSEDEITKIVASLPEKSLSVRPFRICFKGLGQFPEKKKPRVLWIGIDEGQVELTQIHDWICSSLEFTSEEEAWIPHLTIARAKGSVKKSEIPFEQFGALNWGELVCKEILLLESDLSKSPVEYKVLSRFPLSR